MPPTASLGWSLLVERQACSVVLPRADDRQPSIRARTAAHDVSSRSSTIPAADRRGRAAHSVGRLGLYAAHALLPVVLAACAGLGSGDKVSEGLYRLPYDDGTRVRVS